MWNSFSVTLDLLKRILRKNNEIRLERLSSAAKFLFEQFFSALVAYNKLSGVDNFALWRLKRTKLIAWRVVEISLWTITFRQLF